MLKQLLKRQSNKSVERRIKKIEKLNKSWVDKLRDIFREALNKTFTLSKTLLIPEQMETRIEFGRQPPPTNKLKDLLKTS